MGSTAFDIGEAFAVSGMTEAADHADAASPAWSDNAVLLGRVYADRIKADNPTITFQGAHVRQFAESRGLPPPPDARAWGGIIRKLRQAGVIKSVGIGKSPDPRQHAGFVTEWQAA
jgi:hypothetical protein